MVIHELESLRENEGVFRDREHAGELLADMLDGRITDDAIVLPIPAGGVPVGVRIARRFGVELDVAVVSKLTLPWTREAGYGAVAFDGSYVLNEALIRRIGLTDDQIIDELKKTQQKVARRVAHFRSGREPLGARIADRPAVLVDDGLASGFTMMVAIEAVSLAGASSIVVAVPTAHRPSAERIAAEVSTLYCPNVRSGSSFAVASAYERWADVPEVEAAHLLERFEREQARTRSAS
jgi:putative phosphoribosyl transferase